MRRKWTATHGRLRWVPVLLAMLTACLAGPVPATANEFQVPPPDDRFMTDARLVMSDRVAGDLLATGQSLSFSGEVAGDLLAAATDIQITGAIAGSLRSASSSLVLQGGVGRNVTGITSNLLLSQTSHVAGNVYSLSQTATLAGTVRGRVLAHAQRLVLSGHVSGDVTLRGTDANAAPTLVLEPGAQIEGVLRYPEGTTVIRTQTDNSAAGTAQVGAEEVLPTEAPARQKWLDRFGMKQNLRMILSALLLYLVALGLLRLYPGFFTHPTTCLETGLPSVLRAGMAFFGILVAGTLVLALVGLLAMMLFNPLIVMALGLLMVGALVFSLLLATMPVALWIGDVLQRGRASVPGALALGMAVLTATRLLLRLVGAVPALETVAVILSALVGFSVWVAGSGALIHGIRFHHEKAAIGLQATHGGQEGAV
jgi:cytoskeletal protein CcmA (bactofilin family)